MASSVAKRRAADRYDIEKFPLTRHELMAVLNICPAVNAESGESNNKPAPLHAGAGGGQHPNIPQSV
jgi:hypothetical protein